MTLLKKIFVNISTESESISGQRNVTIFIFPITVGLSFATCNGTLAWDNHVEIKMVLRSDICMQEKGLKGFMSSRIYESETSFRNHIHTALF